MSDKPLDCHIFEEIRQACKDADANLYMTVHRDGSITCSFGKVEADSMPTPLTDSSDDPSPLRAIVTEMQWMHDLQQYG